MMKSYSDITYRYLKVQKKRTILTILGIILSVALITAIGTMVVSMRDSMIRDAIRDNGDYHAEFLGVSKENLNKIKSHVEVDNAAISTNEGYALLSKVSQEEREYSPETPPNRYLNITAYDERGFKVFKVPLMEGRLPQTPNEIVVDYWVLDLLPDKPKVGDKIKVDMGLRKSKDSKRYMEINSWQSDEVFEKTGEREFTIVGLRNPKAAWPGGYISGGLTYLDSNNLSDGKSYNVFVKMKSIKDVHTKAQNIAEALNLPKIKKGDTLNYDIIYNERLLRLSAQSLNTSLNTSMILTLAFIIILIIVSTIAVIYNAFNISVLERISQFGVLRCTGASPQQIKKVVFKEAWILSAVGIPLGLFCGVLAMKIVMYIIGILKFDIFPNLTITVSPIVFLISIILGLITIFLSAWGPAMQAAMVSPLEAVRNTGGFKKENFKKVKNSRLAKLLFGIEGQIAFKNLRRNRKRFRITVFSMVISIVLYIVFGSFSDFMFKMDVVDSSEDRGDFAVWINGTSVEGIDIDKYNEIKNMPEVDKVFKYMQSYAEVLVPEGKLNPKYQEMRPEVEKKGNSTLLHNSGIISYGNDNISEFKKNLKEGSIDIGALNRENGVILVQTGRIQYGEDYKKTVILDITRYKVGDIIEFAVERDLAGDKSKNPSYKKAKVMAILDKGILDNEYNRSGGIFLLTTEEVYKNLNGKNNFNYMFIKLKEGTDKEPVAKYLRELKERVPKYQYMDYAEQAKENRNAAVALSIFLYGFVGVISLIGCLNIINTISTNLILRTKELSMLKAVGTTAGSIKKMVSLEAIFYGIIAAVYGSILGTGLSYLLFKIMMDIREFEWYMPVGKIITASIGASLIALIASYIPLRKINKGNIIENIRMEE